MTLTELTTLFAFFAIFGVPILIGFIADLLKLNRIRTGSYDTSQLYHD